MSFEDMRAHLDKILLAFKPKELQAVRYRKLPKGTIPNQITSTTGGSNCYLTETHLGQIFAAGASALLADTKAGRNIQAIATGNAISPPIFYNLVAKQKIVYQSTFKLRRWFEDKKRIITLSTEKSISNIESSLPPLRGEGASIEKYFEELENVKEKL
ncbi:hypothetical protein BGZ46_000694 [Entomortierella lignicola]|nr:hypothetical protein BGZ46_000694 [Entomortierella lignicola]